MEFDLSNEYAKYLDKNDEVSHLRNSFVIPQNLDGTPKIYFCGNSLGLQTKMVLKDIEKELYGWANYAVDAHFHPEYNWYNYHMKFKPSLARILNCEESEVTIMNTLTVNLQLMLTSFYPYSGNGKILTLQSAFPSDRYAVQTFLENRGKNAEQNMVIIKPDAKGLYTVEDFKNAITQHPEISLLLIEAVNYLSGQLMPLKEIIELAKQKNIIIGLDLAHAIGNVKLELSKLDADFAVWCSYKYLNGGPGAIGGCYVNKRHHKSNLSRLAGWWGNDQTTRFEKMHEGKFIPVASTDGWQLSNPSIFSCVPLKSSLDIFDSVDLDKLFAKSKQMTNYLANLINAQLDNSLFEILTPLDENQHGAQISIRIKDTSLYDKLCQLLETNSAYVFDKRKPDVLRITPVPLYNTFGEIWQFVNYLVQVNQEFAH